MGASKRSFSFGDRSYLKQDGYYSGTGIPIFKQKLHKIMIRKTTRYIITVILALVPFVKANASKVIDTKSPDDHITFSVAVSEGEMAYSVSADGNDLISPSSMGLDFGQAGRIPSAGWKVGGIMRSSADKIWKPVWGKSSVVHDHYNETTIELQGPGAPLGKLYIRIRAYNDGIAFRYEIPGNTKGKGAACEKELTTFDFAGDYTAWFYNGERPNLGPVQLTKVDGKRDPVMTIRANDHAYMAILEADLITGAPVVLHSKEGETAFSVVSSPGMIGPGYKSSWRVILYGTTPGTLVDSHVLQLLNPPPAAGSDFSWVKPGVSMWDRRVGEIRIDNFTYRHGTYSTWARMVDFAAKNDIPYLLIDSGWYGPQFSKESDPVNGGKAKEVKQLIAYAEAKGVRILLYINDIGAKDYPIERTLQQYSQWGAAGIKVGFMRTNSVAEKNTRTRMITAMCAKYHLLCDFHDGPVIPYGQLRTYPNAVTREYCHAQLDAHEFVYPKTFVTAVFVNMLAGPLDMTNGVFDLIRMRQTHSEAKHDKFNYAYKTTVPSTVTSEAARTLITFSGITCIPDIPEDYEKFPELLSFISSEKQPWKQSKTLMGAIGEYIVMARQASDGTWLVGAVTDESARKLDIPLSFLGEGKYEATIIQDGNDADYQANRTACKVTKKTVSSMDSVPVRLASGGGACLIIRKE